MPSQNEQGDSVIPEGRKARQSRLVRATLASERLGQCDVTIRNVSSSGFGGKGPKPLIMGETLVVTLPGHGPMMGVVRWVRDQQFGIETEGEIKIEQLRAAHGGPTPESHGDVEFRIMPPSKLRAKRPGLKLGLAVHPRDGKSRWQDQGW